MSQINYEAWEPVIGLECHVQLNTKTKLFGRSRNHFGDEPNTNVDEVDTAQPGTLPILNREAVRKAIQFGLAVGGRVERVSSFDRKSYFYPDAPRNFQITQFFHPIIWGGTITCDMGDVTRHFPINRAHLEDDSGMLKHFSHFAGIDFNRAGIPLIEIVSEPCMHSPKEAAAYAAALRAIVQFLNISTGNMEEGALRFDVNVSVRPKGEKTFRPKIEIKNMNSFHNMELAIESEIRRQIQAYTLHPQESFEKAISPGTYRFDLPTRTTILMRKKENALDYRYFHEPDLPPLHLDEAFIEQEKKTLPELPHQRFVRYSKVLGVPAPSAAILVAEKYVSDFFESGLSEVKNPTALCNWIISEFSGRLKEKGLSLEGSGLQASHVAKLVSMIESGQITGRIAKEVADEMVANPTISPALIVSRNPNYQPVSDESTIEPIVEKIVRENPQSIIDYKNGKERAFSFLVGQVMKETKGKASPEVVNGLLRKKIEQE